MAKFLVEVDTESQSVSVKVNDKEISGISYASVSRYESYDKPGEYEVHFCVTKNEKDDSGVLTYTQMCASETKQGKEAIANGAELKDNLVILSKDNNVQRDIKDLLSKYCKA